MKMKLSIEHSMFHMMFYNWVNADPVNIHARMNENTFTIYSVIVCSGYWSWMK